MSDYQKMIVRAADICTRWWESQEGCGGANPESTAKANRARLQRFLSKADAEPNMSLNLADMYGISAFWLLRSMLNQENIKAKESHVAVTAAVLAFVRVQSESNLRFAQLLGSLREGGDTKMFAEVRFKRLLRSEMPADILPQLHRAVRILGAKAPVGDLGASILFWSAHTRRKWAFDYWGQPWEPTDDNTESANSNNTQPVKAA